jgi:endonuclease V-like protein UPF0215 family
MYSLREVKKEIRVLGIAAKVRPDSATYIVGVVYRGRLYLDGVMRTSANEPDVTGEVASMIDESPHRPQIRVILLDRATLHDGVKIDPIGLSDSLSKPVLALNWGKIEAPGEEHVQGFTDRRGDTGTPVLSVGLNRDTAARVLKTASSAGGPPEALRVAEIIVSAVLDKKHNIIFKRT